MSFVMSSVFFKRKFGPVDIQAQNPHDCACMFTGLISRICMVVPKCSVSTPLNLCGAECDPCWWRYGWSNLQLHALSWWSCCNWMHRRNHFGGWLQCDHAQDQRLCARQLRHPQFAWNAFSSRCDCLSHPGCECRKERLLEHKRLRISVSTVRAASAVNDVLICVLTSGDDQWWRQLTGTLATLAFALCTGAGTMVVCRKLFLQHAADKFRDQVCFALLLQLIIQHTCL